MSMLPMFWLAGCTMGPSAETLVDELRVLAVVSEPPEAGPGERMSLSAMTVDPLEDGYDTLSWTCTFTGESCAESLTGSPWSGLTLTPSPEGMVTTEYVVSPVLGDVLTEEPLPLVQSWTLSCAPGRCPAIDALLNPQDADNNQLQEWLTDPIAMMEALPIEGTSLALRSLRLSLRAPDERAQNPTISCSAESDTDSLEVGEERLFTCTLGGEISRLSAVWGYATAGGWEGSRIELDEGQASVEYRWFAPEDPGEVTIWVVLIDGAGGVGMWEQVLQVP